MEWRPSWRTDKADQEEAERSEQENESADNIAQGERENNANANKAIIRKFQTTSVIMRRRQLHFASFGWCRACRSGLQTETRANDS